MFRVVKRSAILSTARQPQCAHRGASHVDRFFAYHMTIGNDLVIVDDDVATLGRRSSAFLSSGNVAWFGNDRKPRSETLESEVKAAEA